MPYMNKIHQKGLKIKVLKTSMQTQTFVDAASANTATDVVGTTIPLPEHCSGKLKSIPQPLINTIVGVLSINCVSYITVLYPNKNV